MTITSTQAWWLAAAVIAVSYAVWAIAAIRSHKRCPICRSVRQFEMDNDNWLCNKCGISYTTTEGEQMRQKRMLEMHKAIDDSAKWGGKGAA